MRAEIFAIGMGFRLFGWNKINGFTFGNLPENWDGGANTDYRLCLLPIGGYVKISGMVDESFDNDQLVSEPKPWEFRSKNPFQKALVISAGVLFNFILSFGIYSSIAFQKERMKVLLQQFPMFNQDLCAIQLESEQEIKFSV